MGSYRLRVPRRLEELLRGLHPGLKRKARAGLDSLRSEPTLGKALHGELAELRSLRVGAFRIIYRISPGRVIALVAIGPRRTLYEDTLRLLRRQGS